MTNKELIGKNVTCEEDKHEIEYKVSGTKGRWNLIVENEKGEAFEVKAKNVRVLETIMEGETSESAPADVESQVEASEESAPEVSEEQPPETEPEEEPVIKAPKDPLVQIVATTTAVPTQGLMMPGQTMYVKESELDDYVGDVIHQKTKKVMCRKPFELVKKGNAVLKAKQTAHEEFMSGAVSPQTQGPVDIQTGKRTYDPSIDMPPSSEDKG